MTITRDGNVGIGTTSPAVALDVSGSSRISAQLGIAKTPTQPLDVSGTAIISGNVGIGITNPSNKLHVVGSTFLNGIVYANSTVSPNFSDTIDLGSTFLRWGTLYTTAIDSATVGAGTPNLIINANGGKVGIGKVPDAAYQLDLSTDNARKLTTSTWTTGSDVRIKKNIENADIGLCYENLKRMRLKYFEWNSVYGDDVINDRHSLGFIAQEVKEVFPKSVNIIPETTIGNAVFSDFHTLNVDQIDKTHIGATQRLMQVVEAQQEKITTLSGTVEEQARVIDTLQRQMRTLQMSLTQLQGVIAQMSAPA